MQLKVFLLFTLIEVPTDDAFFSQWSAQMMMSLLQYRKHHSVILNGAGKNRPNAVSCAFIALPFLSVQRTTAKSRPQYMMQRTFQPSRKSRGKSKTKKKKKKKYTFLCGAQFAPESQNSVRRLGSVLTDQENETN